MIELVVIATVFMGLFMIAVSLGQLLGKRTMRKTNCGSGAPCACSTAKTPGDEVHDPVSNCDRQES